MRLLKKEVAFSLKKISKFIPVNNVDIIISHKPEHISFGFVSGESRNKSEIELAVNVDHPNFSKNIRQVFLRTLAHELYHIARTQKLDHPETLVEDFVDEGLADHFEMEVSGGKAPKPASTFTSAQVRTLLPKAKKEFYSKKHNCDDWFWGSKKRGIPPKAAYGMGFYIVEKYLRQNPKAKPSNLVRTTALKISPSFTSLLED